MQEEEKTAIETLSNPMSLISDQEDTIIVEDTEKEAKTETALTESTEEKRSSEEKIMAIRSSLYQISKEEEEEAVSLRVAWQIKQVKDKKEHPEKYSKLKPHKNVLKPSMSARGHPKQKQSFGRRVLEILPQASDSTGEVVRKCVFIFSAIVFLACIVIALNYLINLYRADNLHEELASSYHAGVSQTTTITSTETADSNDVEEIETETEAEEKIYKLLFNAADLLEINEEVAGWITIPDTEVDYPIMQHLTDSEGDEYYLYRNIYGEKSNSGSIFLDYRCSFDQVGDDGTLAVENSDNLILYGHNMRDLSMFGSLKYYKSDADYYEEHPIIELNSNYETYQYKIFAYFIADAEDTTDTRFDYWNDINFANETEFYDYVNEVKRRTIRITNIDVEYGDQLLTLATCNSAFDTARLVIVARRVREGEDSYAHVAGSTINQNIKWPNVYYLFNDAEEYDPDAAFAPYG
ncbi:MAG: class B sortase [Ruminococcus sp.]|nr:class B sortase [Ruminococcus sp.]